MTIRTLASAGDLKGKYVFLRGSLNLPLDNGMVADTFRLERLLPTLEYLRKAGARTILAAHIGRAPEDTLLPVRTELNHHCPVIWGGVITTPGFKDKRDCLKDGQVLMAENLRQDPREQANDEVFAEYLASLAEVYVNDAFGNAHREHASIVGVPRYLPAFAGLNMERELRELDAVLTPQSPSLFLLGGAKFQTKLPLIEKHLAIYDHLFVGGALANDLFKAKGFPVGKSLLSDIELDADLVNNPKLLLPVDLSVEGDNGIRVCKPEEVEEHEMIKDAGPATVRFLRPFIEKAQIILWNGPFGQFETGYRAVTEDVAKLVAESSAYSVLGGGDTIAAIEELGINDQFSFLSTGGGSMLTYLEKGETMATTFLRD